MLPARSQVRSSLPLGRQLRGRSELQVLLHLRVGDGGADRLHVGRVGGEGGAEGDGGG